MDILCRFNNLFDLPQKITNTKKSYIYKNNCGEEAQIETIRLVYFGLPH
jgi:hypothetical protein